MEIRLCISAPLAAVLLSAAAVSASTRYSQFTDAHLDNRHFTDHALFVNSSVRSRLDCALLCSCHLGCETFTYTDHGSSGHGTCRGHSVMMTSGSTNHPAAAAESYFLSGSLAYDTTGPCAAGSYMEIDDFRRDVTNSDNVLLCDAGRSFAVGWYRFFINGSSASMPTHCPPTGRCGTHAPMWLDLQKATLPPVGQEVEARACASWSSQCCYSDYDKPVTMRNCGDFYVYYLQKTQRCYYSYCAEL